MSTGGGSGGGFSFKVAEAYVDLFVKDRLDVGLKGGTRKVESWGKAITAAGTRAGASMTSSLAPVNLALARISKSSTVATSNLTKGFGNSVFAVRKLNKDLQQTARIMQSLGGKLPSVPRGPSAGAQLGSFAAGAGRGLGSLLAGAGQGAGSLARGAGGLLRGGGAGLGSLSKGLGGAASGFALAIQRAMRGLSTALGAISRSFTMIASSFGRGLAAAGRGLGGVLRTATAPLRGLSSVVGGAAGLAGIGGGLGAAGGLAFAIHQSSTWETGLANLERILDVNTQTAGRLGDKLRLVATTIPGMKLEKLIQAADVGSRMGVGADGVAKFAKDVSQLSLALGDSIDVEAAAERLGKLASIAGTGSGSIRNMGSALARLDQLSLGSADSIAEVALRVAPLGRIMKMSTADTMALSAALLQSGLHAEVAGSAITQIMDKMASGKSLPAFAKLAGMNSKAFKGVVSNDPLAGLAAVAKGIGGKDTFEAIRDLEALGLEGQRVRTALLALSSVLPELTAFQKASNKEMRTGAALEAALAAKAKTMAAIWERTSASAKSLGIEVGTQLGPGLKKAADSLSLLFVDLTKMVRENAGAINAWAVRVADGFGMLGVAGRSWRSFTDVMNLGWQKALERMQQGWEVFKRLTGRFNQAGIFEPGPALKNLDTIATNMGVLFKNVFSEISRYVANLFSQVVDQLGAKLANALDDALPKVMGGGKGHVVVPPLAPDWVRQQGKNGHEFMGPGRFFPPGFAQRGMQPLGPWMPPNMMQGLPNRNAQMAPIMGRLWADRKAQVEERAKAAAGLAAEDAAGKAAAQAPIRAEVERRKMQIGLMRPGMDRTNAMREFMPWAGGLGLNFAPGELTIPTRAQALRQQSQQRLAAIQARNRAVRDAREARLARGRKGVGGAGVMGPNPVGDVLERWGIDNTPKPFNGPVMMNKGWNAMARMPTVGGAARAQLQQIQGAARPQQKKDDAQEIGKAMAAALMQGGQLTEFGERLIRAIGRTNTIYF